MPSPNRTTPDAPSAEMERFLSSMVMNYEKWRDGIGYDLEALDALNEKETADTVELLTDRVNGGQGDWYDLEALARVGSPESRVALAGALKNSNASIRLRAAEYLAEQAEDSGEPLSPQLKLALESEIVALLRDPRCEVRIDLLTRLAEQFATPAIQEALLWCSLDGREDLRVHTAALALYLAGGAPEAFDWEQRPLFLEFGESDRSVREKAMTELKRRMDAERA